MRKMPAKKIIAEQKIVQEKDGRIHGYLRMGFQFTEDEKKSALMAMMNGLASVADNWQLLPYVFDVMRNTEEEMKKRAGT